MGWSPLHLTGINSQKNERIPFHWNTVGFHQVIQSRHIYILYFKYVYVKQKKQWKPHGISTYKLQTLITANCTTARPRINLLWWIVPLTYCGTTFPIGHAWLIRLLGRWYDLGHSPSTPKVVFKNQQRLGTCGRSPWATFRLRLFQPGPRHVPSVPLTALFSDKISKFGSGTNGGKSLSRGLQARLIPMIWKHVTKSGLSPFQVVVWWYIPTGPLSPEGWLGMFGVMIALGDSSPWSW